MDFGDTPAEKQFRKEAIAWLEENLPRIGDSNLSSQGDREKRSRLWQEALYEGGWAGISWPVEYGGRGLSIVHEAIFNAEAGSRGAPRPINFLAMMLAGPTILVHGTEEQKNRYLPKILSGEEVWCQGFSEPGAGSDLASLKTNAVRTDDHWVVNGHKIWTSFAHIAQRCMLLARTDREASKHAGLTYFCAPMDEVGVSPITMINRDADFNETFWEDVAVPDQDVLGPVGSGWRVALTTLGFERGALSLLFYVDARQALDRLILLIQEVGKTDDPLIVDRIGSFAGEVDALHLLIIRQLSTMGSGGTPGPEGSVPKLVWSRLMQDMTRFALDVGGREGVLVDDVDDSSWTHHYLRARGNSIEGGTSEILRSIVAERVLGLPRSR